MNKIRATDNDLKKEQAIEAKKINSMSYEEYKQYIYHHVRNKMLEKVDAPYSKALAERIDADMEKLNIDTQQAFFDWISDYLIILIKYLKENYNSKEELEKSEQIATGRPRRYSQSVTKLTENLPALDYSGDKTEQDFIVSPKKAKKLAKVTLITDNTSLAGRSILPFDNTVLNAVVSFIEAGEQVFTLEQITNFIYYGDNTDNRASKKQQEEVRASIRKQMSFLVNIDYTRHLTLNGVPLEEMSGRGKLTDQRLPLKEIETTNRNGNAVICYSLKDNDLPPEYIYCKDVKQLATVDARLLDTTQGLHLKSEDVVWRDYFIREIDTMRKKKSYSRTMLIDTILQKCGITFTTKKPRDERSDLLKRFETLLQDFVSKKYIKEYGVKRGKRNVIEGYDIEL